MSRSGGVSLRAVAASAGLAGLLILVAVTTVSVPGGESAGRDWLIDRGELAAVMRQVLFVAYLAILAHAFYLWLMWRGASRRSASRSRRLAPVGVTLFLILLLVVVVFLVLQWDELVTPGEDGTSPTVTTVPDFEGGGVPLPDGAPASTSPAPDWPILLVGLGILAIGVVVAVARRRPVSDGPGLRAASAPAAVASSARRQAPPPSEPRERIFGAYQGVEDAAGRIGLHRRPSETVFAHLRRLASFRPEASAQLASLYNRARFSRHVMADEDASRAERAGEEIRRGLQ